MPVQSTVNRYLAAFTAVAIALVAALTTAGDGQVSTSSAWQIALVGVSAVGVYLLPLLPGKYRATAKVGVAVAAAVLTAIIPLAQQGTISGVQVAVVVLAGLQALGAKVGVDARLDDEQMSE